MTSEQPVPSPAVASVRRDVLAVTAAQAQLVRSVAAMVRPLEADLVALADAERRTGSVFARSPDAALEEARSTVVDEVALALGVARHRALVLVHHARRLVDVLPEVLERLGDGRLDLDRVTGLVRAVEHLPDARAREAASRVLAEDDARLRRLGRPGGRVWDLVQPSTWREHVNRSVASADAAVAADPEAEPPPAVVASLRVHVDDPRHAELVFAGSAADVLALHAAVRDLTAVLVPPGAPGPDGRPLRVGEREALGLRTALAGVVTTGALPDGGAATRTRELGVVLHADTLFDDGPAAADPGQVRGAGRPLHVPAQDARRHAADAVAFGAPTSVLLTDRTGRLGRLLRVGAAPEGGWTRAALHQAVRAALGRAVRAGPSGHDPTVTVADHVRAAHPTSCAPVTGVATHSGSSTVDLDHVVPYPHGPTTTDNLRPLHRTPHRRKTRGVWRSRLTGDGDLEWTSRLGTTWTHVDEPLPGYFAGEAYAGRR